MRSVDKNDVDVKKLFRWKKQIEVSDQSETPFKLWIRIVGDADINRAKTYGYRKASELRKKLRTEDSDERLSFIAELEDFSDKESLINSMILLRTQDLFQAALRTVDLQEPKEPHSDDRQEIWEKYQEDVDSYPTRFADLVEEKFISLKEAEYDKLNIFSFEDLHKMYEDDVINQLCSDELNKCFYDMCIVYGTYTDEDCKNRLFLDAEEFDNIHTLLKSTLRKAYKDLEVGADFLKA